MIAIFFDSTGAVQCLGPHLGLNCPCTIARMLLLLSPAKSLDFETPLPAHASASGRLKFHTQTAELMARLRAQSPAQLASLMA